MLQNPPTKDRAGTCKKASLLFYLSPSSLKNSLLLFKHPVYVYVYFILLYLIFFYLSNINFTQVSELNKSWPKLFKKLFTLI